jgi:hypothetical protein
MQVFTELTIRRSLATAGILAILLVDGGGILTPQPLGADQEDQQQQPPKLSAAQLDEVVARVALYPDPLLAQVMAAATFVEQIPDADLWAARHKNLQGDALAQAMDNAHLGFDPGVQALIAFPSVLELMNNDLAWTQTLGDATLIQRGDIMAAVQRMRQRAYAAGTLRSTQQNTVLHTAPQVIEIQPPSPVIYVPVYNPQVVYVFQPAPSAALAIGFAFAVALSPSYRASYWGYHPGFGWSSRTVIIIYNGAWGRTWVNHRTYIHTWGGVNRGFYNKPYAYVNTSVYARKTKLNVNKININNNDAVVNSNNMNPGSINARSVDLNRNNLIGSNTPAPNGSAVNPDTSGGNRNGVNRSARTVNRGSYQSQCPSPYTIAGSPVAEKARGYAKQNPAAPGVFTGVQNGKSEQMAAARGKLSRGK